MESPLSAGAPASPTQYSLDLDALNLGDTESLSIPEANMNRIESDDIDGPTDFTINLGKYINGKGSAFNRREAAPDFSQSRQIPFEETTTDENHQDASLAAPVPRPVMEEPTASVTDIDNLDHASDHGDATANDDTTNMSIFIPDDTTTVSMGAEQEKDQDQDQDSSIWEPQHNSSSLRYSDFRRPRNLLQPTVEDYNSELTPARPHSAVARSTYQLTPDPPRRPVSALDLHQSPRPSLPNTTSGPTMSPSRRALPLDKQRTEELDLQVIRAELEELRRAHDQAQDAVDTLSAQLNKERQNSRTLKSDIELVKERSRQIDQAKEAARNKHDAELRDLKREIDTMRRSEQDLHRLAEQQAKDLEAAKVAERDAIHQANTRAKELDQIHESENSELEELRWQVQQAQDSEQRAQRDLEDLRQQMDAQGRAHDDQVQRLGRDLASARSDTRDAKDSEKSVQESLRLLRQQMNDHATSLRDETNRLREELGEANRSEELARSDADRHIRELEKLRADHAAHLQSTTQAHVKLERRDSEAMRRAEESRQTLESQLHDARAQISAITSAREAEQAAKLKAEHDCRTALDARTKMETQLAQLGRERKAEQEAREKAEDEIKVLKEELEIEQGFSRLDEVDVPELDAPELHLPNHSNNILDTGYDKVLKMSEALKLEVEAIRQQMRDQQAKHDAGMKDIKVQYDAKMKHVKSQHKTSIEGIMLRLVAQKEEDARLRGAEIEEHRRAITVMQDHMALANQSSEASNNYINALKHECAVTQDCLAKARKALQEQRVHVSTQKRNSDEMPESLKWALEAADDAKKALEHKEMLKVEVERKLKTALQALSEKEARVKALQQQYEVGQEEMKKAEEGMKKAQEELQARKNMEIKWKEEVQRRVRDRDVMWKGKLDAAVAREEHVEQLRSELEKENKFMGKVLLIQWGREECGVVEGSKTQRYRHPKSVTKDALQKDAAKDTVQKEAA